MKKFVIKKILIPVDFTIPSLNAINPAVALAKRNDAEITLMHVLDILPSTAPAFYYSFPNPGIPEFEKELTDMSNHHLNKIAVTIKKKGIAKVKVLSVQGRAHHEIVRFSKKLKTDIIIMGTHGTSGYKEYFIGSNSFRVVSNAQCPVLSIQQHIKAIDFKNILVPFRDKPHAREKVMYAIEMAKICGATLNILGVDTEAEKSHFKKMMLEGEQIKKIVENHEVKSRLKVIKGAYVGDTVLKYAKEINADLIIVTADMDKVSIAEYFMGPFAQQIVNHSPIPVLSVRPTFNTDTIDMRFY